VSARSRVRAAAVVAALALPALSGCTDSGDEEARRERPKASPPAEPTRVLVPEGLDRGPFDARRIYRALAPGVVTVLAESDEGVLGEQRGIGSGFVLDGQGHVATNAHVIRTNPPALDPVETVYVEFADGNRVEAEVVGDDLFSDVALLKIEPRGLTLTPLELGRSSDLTVGEPVAAIGSPFGERQSLSVGVISALDRSIESLTSFKTEDAIQTDAAINHGNSGGPLIGRDGRVIGINAQIESTGGGGEGVGFAVSVDVVRRSLAQLREDGDVDYAFAGITSQDLYPQLARRLGFGAGRGALVRSVQDGGPADDAGIEAGDRRVEFQGERGIPIGGDAIVGIDGRPVRGSSDVAEAIGRLRPGQRVRFEVMRGGERREVEVELGARSATPPGG
jgi:S1-C subfamily serine protease